MTPQPERRDAGPTHGRDPADSGSEPEVFDALVLAGRRAGEDPFAARHGAAHRALIPARGVPMLERVIATLRRVPRVGRIAVSTDAPEQVGACREIARRIQTGDVAILDAAESPARSVLAALDERAIPPPLLVTTADHALLQPEMVATFLDSAAASDADLLAAFVAGARVRARFPGSRRTYLPLRGGSYSGANLFALLHPAARHALDFWVRTESIRKRPWRLASLLGPVALARFALRRADLEQAMQTLSRSAGARVRAVELPFAEAAVDVDREADLDLAERVLAEREAAGAAPPARQSSRASISTND